MFEVKKSVDDDDDFMRSALRGRRVGIFADLRDQNHVPVISWAASAQLLERRSPLTSSSFSNKMNSINCWIFPRSTEAVFFVCATHSTASLILKHSIVEDRIYFQCCDQVEKWKTRRTRRKIRRKKRKIRLRTPRIDQLSRWVTWLGMVHQWWEN